MMKKLKLVVFLVFGVLFCIASVQAATIIGDNITTMGNIGIGTTTPSEKLVVSGNSIFEGFTRFSDTVWITNQTNLSNEASLTIDSLFTATSSARIQLRGTSSQLIISSGESLWPTAWHLGVNTGGEDIPNQDFQIRQMTDGSGVVDLARLTILKANGRVGIGTTTPAFNLTVDGSILATNSLRVGEGNEFISTNYQNGLTFWTNGNERMILDSIGNFGIGTSTPESILHVYENNATSTVTVGGVDASTKGACLKLRDSDGLGWTYCTTLDGSLSCSVTSCE